MTSKLSQAHAWARIWFGSAVLVLVIMEKSLETGFLLLGLLICLLRIVQGDFKRLLRLTGLLRWFLPPIFLLHAFFTPGSLMFPDIPLSVSREGMLQGLWICIHFSDIYLAAMLLGSMLKLNEWLQLLGRVPGFQKWGGEHLLMLSMMHRNIYSILKQMNRQWRVRQRWKHAPGMLMAAVRQALNAASVQARVLWIRWPTGLACSVAVKPINLCASIIIDAALFNLGLMAVMLSLR